MNNEYRNVVSSIEYPISNEEYPIRNNKIRNKEIVGRNEEIVGGRSGRDWSGSLLNRVTLTAGRQERPKKATWRTLPEKEPAKQLKRKARPPA